MGLMPCLKSIMLDGNPLRTLRRDIVQVSTYVQLTIDQLHVSKSMQGMSDVTSGCSFAARKVL